MNYNCNLSKYKNLDLLYIPDGKMATQYGRSLEVSEEVEDLSTNSHSQGENSGDFIASTASDQAKLQRVRGLFRRRRKTKNEGEEKESVTKNRPYGEMSV